MATQKQTGKETTSAGTKAVTAPQPQSEQALAEMALYKDFEGAGFEGQTKDDLSIPFLVILQGQSKQLQDNRELRPGMIYNTATGEAVDGDEGISFIPAFTQHLYVEWKRRDAGGGFVGIHEINDPMVLEAQAKAKALGKPFGDYNTAYDDKGEPVGNDLIETFYVYGLSLGADRQDCLEATLAFTSTGIKVYKNWNTRAKSIQLQVAPGQRISAPLFCHVYRLKTVSQKNAQGTWYGWTVGFDGEDAAASRLSPTDMRFQAASKMGRLIQEGSVRVAHENVGGGQGTSGGGGAAPPVTGDKPVF